MPGAPAAGSGNAPFNVSQRRWNGSGWGCCVQRAALPEKRWWSAAPTARIFDRCWCRGGKGENFHVDAFTCCFLYSSCTLKNAALKKKGKTWPNFCLLFQKSRVTKKSWFLLFIWVLTFYGQERLIESQIGIDNQHQQHTQHSQELS